ELNRRVVRVLRVERDAFLRAALEELHLGLVEAALDLGGFVRLIALGLAVREHPDAVRVFVLEELLGGRGLRDHDEAEGERDGKTDSRGQLELRRTVCSKQATVRAGAHGSPRPRSQLRVRRPHVSYWERTRRSISDGLRFGRPLGRPRFCARAATT